MVRLGLENFRCRGVLLVRIIVGQGPTMLAVGSGGGYLDIFLSPVILFFPPFSRRRPEMPKNQPTDNQPSIECFHVTSNSKKTIT